MEDHSNNKKSTDAGQSASETTSKRSSEGNEDPSKQTFTLGQNTPEFVLPTQHTSPPSSSSSMSTPALLDDYRNLPSPPKRCCKDTPEPSESQRRLFQGTDSNEKKRKTQDGTQLKLNNKRKSMTGNATLPGEPELKRHKAKETRNISDYMMMMPG